MSLKTEAVHPHVSLSGLAHLKQSPPGLKYQQELLSSMHLSKSSSSFSQLSGLSGWVREKSSVS